MRPPAVAMDELTGGVLVLLMRAVVAVRVLVRPGPVVNVATVSVLVLGGAVDVTMRPGVGVRVAVMMRVDVVVVVVVRVAELGGAPRGERPA